MKMSSTHRGSALLIVLGMLAFMIISAVAFSAYMRYSRLPSSYLRRTSSSRHLAHAALAEAIDIIDVSIGNNPHPGVGTQASKYPREDGYLHNRNHWKCHVYTGTNTLLSASETVSTLTLEGLAYLPPALINEARYYSRHSVGGEWHQMNYDAGRFAFCAVDVSDHLNINKIPANYGRTSAPATRFSLAYAFEDEKHQGYTVKPSAFDSFMKNYVDLSNILQPIEADNLLGSNEYAQPSSSRLPLTSWADLNLAVYAKGSAFSKYLSPFANYIENDESDFVKDSSGPEADIIRRMSFITDSWYPPTRQPASSAEDYDLADDENQPFDSSWLKKGATTAIRNIIDASRKSAIRLREKISRLGLVMLKDYLDEDNVPTSLAIPQVERTPMICGIKNTINGSSISISKTTEPDNLDSIALSDTYPNVIQGNAKASAENTQRTIQYVKKYSIDAKKFTQGLRSGSIKAVVAYPFRSSADTAKPDSFTIDGHVEVFFTSGELRFRTGEADDLLHLENDSDFNSRDFKNGVLHIPLQQTSCKFDNVEDEQTAVKEFDFMTAQGANSGATVLGSPFLEVTYTEVQHATSTKIGEDETWTWTTRDEPERTAAHCTVPALTSSGSSDSTFADDGRLLTYLKGGGTTEWTLRETVVLRIKNGDGKVVDKVPATLYDDRYFNQLNNAQSMGAVGNQMCGKPTPLMRFTASGSKFTFNDDVFDKGVSDLQVEFLPKGVMCPDPRWNWAPEQWFVDEDVSKDGWLQKCGRGAGSRDEDIFMATSDAGYMQSIYELAFLPRITNLENTGNNEIFGNIELVDDDRSDWATSIDQVRNNGLMWTTYRPFARNGVVRDLFEFDNGGFVSEGGGAKINPYTDQIGSLMAAFANTPLDWWVASGTDQVRGQDVNTSRDSVEEFNKRYTFSSLSGADVKFGYGHLEQIASRFSTLVRSEAQDSLQEVGATDAYWQDAFDKLFAQSSGDNTFCGVDISGSDSMGNQTDDLLSIDKKFLYGYWHDCFAARQQLFLIFVRAEPMMMGGGAIGQTPPQLGARAVALVWRDPAYVKTQNNDQESVTAPHRTRVLFYRQFD